MTFLAPWTALLAGAIAIPALLLLYVLKLRRRPLRVATTLLWDAARTDLEVNTPWQKLTATPLLFLQLLIVLLLLLALAEPVIDAPVEPADRTILLIDRSASMGAGVGAAVTGASSGRGVDPGSASTARDDDAASRAVGPFAETRFDRALDVARAVIETRTRARGGRDAGEVMIIAFGRRPTIVQGFDRRAAVLLAALDQLRVTDEPGDLAAAIRLAGSLGREGGLEGSDATMPEVVLVTDGGGQPGLDTPPLQLPRASLDVRLVGDDAGRGPGAAARSADAASAASAAGAPGAATDDRRSPRPSIANVGIVALTARRADDDPIGVRVFVRVANTDRMARRVRLTAELDGVPTATRLLDVPPADPFGPPGDAAVAFDLEAPEASVLRVATTVVAGDGDRGASADVTDAGNVDGNAGSGGADGGATTAPAPAPPASASSSSTPSSSTAPTPAAPTSDRPFVDRFPVDDVAAVRLPPPARPAIALVSSGDDPDPALLALLEAGEPSVLRRFTPAAWSRWLDSGEADTPDGRVDLVVVDAVADLPLPPRPSVWFGGNPLAVDTMPPSRPGGRRLITWRRTHPVLRYVDLDDLAFAGFGAWTLPPGAETLATGADGPVIAELTDRGVRHVLVGFELDRSNWSTSVGFAVFLQNVITRLAATGAGRSAEVAPPGDPVTARRRGTEAVIVRAPDGSTQTVVTGVDPRGGGSGGGGTGRTEGSNGGSTGATGDTGGNGDGGASDRAGRRASFTTVVLPGLSRVGVYRVDGVEPPHDVVTVSLLDDGESDVRPVQVVRIEAPQRRIARGEARGPVDLWPWLVVAAGVLLAIEWTAYCVAARRQ